ncbi:MAG: metallophosphoesterase [bacterium]
MKKIVGLFLLLMVWVSSYAATWGPVQGSVTSTSIEFSWRTDNGAESLTFEGKKFSGSPTGNYRTVNLRDLTPDSDYSYSFNFGEDVVREYKFHTAPLDNDASFTFVAYGDTRTNYAKHTEIAAAILTRNPRFVINSGDLVENGEDADMWKRFFLTARSLMANTVYLPVVGNHEHNTSYFAGIFPWTKGVGEVGDDAYSFIYGGVRMVFLNSTRNVEKQAIWLQNYLKESGEGVNWTIVTCHYPPYSSGPHGSDKNAQKYWVPIFEKYKVDVVFAGHDHFYERSEKNGVQYIITGGGGAPLYDTEVTKNPYRIFSEKTYHYVVVDVKPETMSLKMMKLNGESGDEVQLEKNDVKLEK